MISAARFIDFCQCGRFEGKDIYAVLRREEFPDCFPRTAGLLRVKREQLRGRSRAFTPIRVDCPVVRFTERTEGILGRRIALKRNAEGCDISLVQIKIRRNTVCLLLSVFPVFNTERQASFGAAARQNDRTAAISAERLHDRAPRLVGNDAQGAEFLGINAKFVSCLGIDGILTDGKVSFPAGDGIGRAFRRIAPFHFKGFAAPKIHAKTIQVTQRVHARCNRYRLFAGRIVGNIEAEFLTAGQCVLAIGNRRAAAGVVRGREEIHLMVAQCRLSCVEHHTRKALVYRPQHHKGLYRLCGTLVPDGFRLLIGLICKHPAPRRTVFFIDGPRQCCSGWV